MSVDLFQLGFDLKTETVEQGLTRVSSKLRKVAQDNEKAQESVKKGFRGSSKEVLAYNSSLSVLQGKLDELKVRASTKGLSPVDRDEIQKSIVGLNKSIERWKRLTRAARSSEEALNRAVKVQRQLTAIAGQQSAALAEQAVAQKALSSGIAVTAAEAEKFARVYVRLQSLGAGSKRLRNLEKETIQLREMRIETQRLATEQAKSSTAPVAKAAILSGQDNVYQKQAIALAALKSGIAATRVEAGKYAAVLLELRALGASDQEIAAWEEKFVAANRATKAVRDYEKAQVEQAAVASRVLAEQASWLERLKKQELSRVAALESVTAAQLHSADVQVVAFDLLTRGIASTRIEAERYAKTILGMRALGADSNQIATWEAEQVRVVALTERVTLLTAARERDAAAAALLGKQAANLAVQTAALDALTAGYFKTAAGARAYADQLIALRALGATPLQEKTLLRVAMETEVASIATAQLTARMNAEAAAARRAAVANTQDAASLDQVSRASHSTRSAFQRLEHSVTRLRTGLFSILSIIAILGFDKLVRGLIETSQLLSVISRGLDIVTGSSSATAEQISRLKNLANGLGIEYAILARNFSKFAVASKGQLSLKESEDVFIGTSEALRALGKDQVDTERVFKALEQIVGKGVVSLEELRGQLGESLPSAMRVMARELGITQSRLIKLVSTGALPARSAVLALARGLHEDFSTAAKEAANTIAAAIARIRNSFFQLFEGTLKGGANDKILSSLNNLNKSLQNPETVAAITSLISLLIRFTTTILNNADAIVRLLKELAIFGAIFAGYKILFAGLPAIFTAVTTGFIAFSKAVAAATIGIRAALVLATGFAITPFGAALIAIGLLIAGYFLARKAILSYVDSTEKQKEAMDSALGKTNGMTDAQRRLAAQTQAVDSAMLGLQESLRGVGDLYADIAAEKQNYEDLQTGKNLLRSKGLTEGQIENVDQTKLTKLIAERRKLDELKSKQSILPVLPADAQPSGPKASSSFFGIDQKTSSLVSDTSKILNAGLRDSLATHRSIVSASMDEIEANRTLLDLSEETLAGLAKSKDAEKTSRKESKNSLTESINLTRSLADYQADVEINLQQSAVAVQLLSRGYASTAEEAQDYAKILGGFMKRGASLDSPIVQAQLQEIKARQAAIHAINEQIDALEKLDKLKKDSQADKERFAVERSINVDDNANRQSIAEEIRLRVAALNPLEKSEKKLKEIVRTAVEHEASTRRSLLLEEQRTAEIERRQAAERSALINKLSQDTAINPRADLEVLADQLAMMKQLGLYKGDGSESDRIALGIAQEVEASLRRQNALYAEGNKARERAIAIENEKLAQKVTQSPGFNARIQDPRDIAKAAQDIRASAPGVSDQDAIGQAISKDQEMKNLNKDTDAFLARSLQVKDVWQGLGERWQSHTTLLVGINESLASTVDIVANQLGDAVADVAFGTKSIGDAFRDLATTAIRQLISALIQVGIQQAINAAAGESLKATSTAATIIELEAIGIAAATPAALVNIASYGTAAEIATATLSASVAAANALGFAHAQEGKAVQKGKPHLVGEGGRELFVPEQNGRILSRSDTDKLMKQTAEARDGDGNRLFGSSYAKVIDFENFVGKRRQSGGAVAANTPYMVGEAGRELFIPSQSGAPVSRASASLGGDVKIIVNNNASGVDIETRTTVDENGRREIVIEAVRQARQAVKSDFQQSVSRGHGPYASTIESGYKISRNVR